MRLVVREPIGQKPYWKSFSELTPNRNRIIGYSSRRDPQRAYLFYKFQRPKRWLCAIIRKLNGDGFLITAYPTDAIKEGEIQWQK